MELFAEMVLAFLELLHYEIFFHLVLLETFSCSSHSLKIIFISNKLFHIRHIFKTELKFLQNKIISWESNRAHHLLRDKNQSLFNKFQKKKKRWIFNVQLAFQTLFSTHWTFEHSVHKQTQLLYVFCTRYAPDTKMYASGTSASTYVTNKSDKCIRHET